MPLTRQRGRLKLQGLKSVRQDKGVLQIGADMLGQPRAAQRGRVRQLPAPAGVQARISPVFEQQIAEPNQSRSLGRKSGRS